MEWRERYFPEMSGKFPGNFRKFSGEISRTFPGKNPGISEKCPGNVRESFQEIDKNNPKKQKNNLSLFGEFHDISGIFQDISKIFSGNVPMTKKTKTTKEKLRKLDPVDLQNCNLSVTVDL